MRKVIIVHDSREGSDPIRVYSNRKKVFEKYKNHFVSYRVFCTQLENHRSITFKVPYAFFDTEIKIKAYYIN